MKILVYTFSTNKHQTELKSYFGEIFLFKRLKEDLKKFSKKILIEKPELILGIGNSNKSRIETEAINQFNRNKKIENLGPKKYTLEEIDINLPLAKKPTDSFCNWSAYKLANFIKENKLSTKIAFIHLAKHGQLPFSNKDFL